MIRDYLTLVAIWAGLFLLGFLLCVVFNPFGFFAVAMAMGVLLLSGLLSALLILVLKPILIRYALARPNARSSHRIPTPQGGGIAVVGAALLMVLLPAWFMGLPGHVMHSFL